VTYFYLQYADKERIKKKYLPLTSGKPQAATQAKYAFVPPAPYLPVMAKFRTGNFGSCNFETNIQEKDMPI